MTEVKDYRKCSRKDLTDLEIDTRIHKAYKALNNLREEEKEIHAIINGLREERNRRYREWLAKEDSND